MEQKRRWLEGWGGDDLYSPIDEAERIARFAANQEWYRQGEQAEPLWEYAVASFRSLIDRKLQGEPDNKDEESPFFRAYNAEDERYPGLEIIFSKPTSYNQAGTVGSVIFTRSTPQGRDVLAYTLVEEPEGLNIQREARWYAPGTALQDLSIENMQDRPYVIVGDMSPLTNDEALSVIGYADQQANGYSETGDSAPAADTAGIGAGSVDSMA